MPRFAVCSVMEGKIACPVSTEFKQLECQEKRVLLRGMGYDETLSCPAIKVAGPHAFDFTVVYELDKKAKKVDVEFCIFINGKPSEFRSRTSERVVNLLGAKWVFIGDTINVFVRAEEAIELTVTHLQFRVVSI
jgi:hypothetical protein